MTRLSMARTLVHEVEEGSRRSALVGAACLRPREALAAPARGEAGRQSKRGAWMARAGSPSQA